MTEENNEENIFEKYLEKENGGIKGFFKRPKSWVIILMTIVAIVIAILFYRSTVIGGMSGEEIKKSVTIVWYDTKWVEKSSLPMEVKIVPSVRLKIKNTGNRPLQSMDIDAVFERVDTGEGFDDGFVRVFEKPLQPGETSEEILVAANYGYTARSKASFLKNKETWKKMRARIFARSMGSGLIQVGDVIQVKQEVEGVTEESVSAQPVDSDFPDEITRELGTSLQVEQQDSLWINKVSTPKEVIIVPSITVTLKNIGKNPIKDISVKGIFRYENTGEILTEGATFALSRSLEPGAISAPIEIRGEFGYSASSNDAFIQGNQKWKLVKVNVFVRSKSSQDALLGTYPLKAKLQITQ